MRLYILVWRAATLLVYKITTKVSLSLTKLTENQTNGPNEAWFSRFQIEITAYRTENRQEYAFVVDDLTVDPGHCKQGESFFPLVQVDFLIYLNGTMLMGRMLTVLGRAMQRMAAHLPCPVHIWPPCGVILAHQHWIFVTLKSGFYLQSLGYVGLLSKKRNNSTEYSVSLPRRRHMHRVRSAYSGERLENRYKKTGGVRARMPFNIV